MIETLLEALTRPCHNMIYRRRKFDVHCSIGLFQTPYAHDIHMIQHYIRLTDTALPVTPNISVILYEYTAIDKAKFAFTNLINTFAHHNVEPIVAYTQVYDSDRVPEMIIHRLYDILQEARKSHTTLMDDHLYRSSTDHGIDFSDILG